MNNQQKKDPIQEQAEELVYAYFKITLKTGFPNVKEAWQDAITAAELAVEEKKKSVLHQQELFTTAFKTVKEKDELITDKGILTLSYWCNDHLAELELMKNYVGQMRKSKVKVKTTVRSSADEKKQLVHPQTKDLC